ncbi:hypothetical protein G9A89_017767 [Geosiphon pyriformis]|nr:hypothetical protein G9A89_017767 [Geosiphon pyriformis]
MKGIFISSFLLLLICLSDEHIVNAKKGPVLLTTVKTLTLYKGKKTTGKRTSPGVLSVEVPQIECVGGDACHIFEPDVIQCNNMGSDGEDVQWKCQAELPDILMFGRIEVGCEGYDYPEDPYILRGSCGLQYTLYFNDLGNKKKETKNRPYSDSDPKDHHIPKDWDGPPQKGSKLFTYIFTSAWLGVCAFIFYNIYLSLRSPNPQNRWPAGNFDSTPPPPYSPMPSSSHFSTQTPPQQTRGIFDNVRSIPRPGFWSGVGLSGLAHLANHYLLNRNNNNNKQEQQTEPTSRSAISLKFSFPVCIFFNIIYISFRQHATGNNTFDRRYRDDFKNNSSSKTREELRALGKGSIEFKPDFSPSVGLITLRNPERHNALSGKMMAELADIVDRLEEIVRGKECNTIEDSLVGLIMEGSEKKSFCAGLDLSVARDHILEPESGAKMSSLMQDTLFRFNRLSLVSVAAVEGYALGGGAELTTACDYRCLAKLAQVRFVQIKMATTPGWGGGARLVNIVGQRKALTLLGTSRALKGQESVEIGFTDMVAENREAVTTATHFLDSFVYSDNFEKNGIEKFRERNSVKAMRSMKTIIAAAKEIPEPVRHLEHSLFANLWGAPDNKKAILDSTKKS